uniref:Uncharacterized protein n=1 Tax=Siphoviridae sp. ctM3g2 TaxID=2826255 RepID=A0A8S5LUQ2_9CAUD|nr:MAG TPA: hypothetical protein [Siphoviridae sp. ctM3g2]
MGDSAHIVFAALPHAARNLPPMILFCLRRSDYFLVPK